MFLTFESVDQNRPVGKNTLTFASYPTIAFDGLISFDSFVELKAANRFSKNHSGTPLRTSLRIITLAGCWYLMETISGFIWKAEREGLEEVKFSRLAE